MADAFDQVFEEVAGGADPFDAVFDEVAAATPSMREQLRAASGDERDALVSEIRSSAAPVPVATRVGAKSKATLAGAKGFLEHYFPGQVEYLGSGDFAIFDESGQPVMTLEGRGLVDQITDSGPLDVLGMLREAYLDVVDVAPEALEGAIGAAGAVGGATLGAGGGTVAAPGVGTIAGGLGGGAAGAMLGRSARQLGSELLPGEDFPQDAQGTAVQQTVGEANDRAGDILFAGASDVLAAGAGEVLTPVARPVAAKGKETLAELFAHAPRAVKAAGKAAVVGGLAESAIPGSGLTAAGIQLAQKIGTKSTAKKLASKEFLEEAVKHGDIAGELTRLAREAGEPEVAQAIAREFERKAARESQLELFQKFAQPDPGLAVEVPGVPTGQQLARRAERLISVVEDRREQERRQDITRRGGIRR